nr:SprT-like domain-containing protein [Acinetobacter baumannii]
MPLLEVLQTLVHEMVHAWQFHFGKPGRRGYHNKEWADKMEAIGLMPSSTGKPGGARTGEKMADYAIPGGLFMQATDKLLTQDFKISWLDRFPPMTTIAAPIADTGDIVNGNLKLTPFTLKQQSKIDPFDDLLRLNLWLNSYSLFIF